MNERGVMFSPIFIAVPVLNEADNILLLLDGIEAVLEGNPHFVCVVDDGSTDGTVDLLRRRSSQEQHPELITIFQTKTRHGSQRGAALKTALEWGLANTEAQVFVEMDGDLSHRPEELLHGVGAIAAGQGDVIIASKFLAGSVVTNRSVGRRMLSQVCSSAVRLLINGGVHDWSNGLRFFSRDAAQLVATHKIRYGSPIYLSEVLALWLKHGLRVREIPTRYLGRNEGLSKLRLIDLVKAAIAAFEISFRYHLTGFPPRDRHIKGAA